MNYVKVTYDDKLADDVQSRAMPCLPISMWHYPTTVLRYASNGAFDTEEIQRGAKIIRFTLDDDVIELLSGSFVIEPTVELLNMQGLYIPNFVAISYIIKNGTYRGKMRVHKLNEDPFVSDYKINLDTAQIDMIIGLELFTIYKHIIHKFNYTSLNFTYHNGFMVTSFFDNAENECEEKLLKLYLAEYVMSDVLLGIREHHRLTLNINPLVYNPAQIFSRGGYNAKLCRIHNRKMQAAFNNLALKIIDLTKSKLKKLEFEVNNVYGIDNSGYDHKVLKSYRGSISNFNSLSMIPNKDVIVTTEGDVTVIYIPVKFMKLIFSYSEHIHDDFPLGSYHTSQFFDTTDDYICIGLEKLNEHKVDLTLIEFKIKNIRCRSHGLVDIIMDHIMRQGIEMFLNSLLEYVLENEELQELAIEPDIEIEYYADDFTGSPAEENMDVCGITCKDSLSSGTDESD